MQRHKLEKLSADGVQCEFNPKEYEEKFGSIVNKGFIALGIALGHKVGLFKALREFNAPVTSQELANSRRLKERYVREWLGSMTAAELVFMTEDNKYYLPCDPDMNSVEILSLLLPESAKRIDDVYDCFQLDGPSGYTYVKHNDVFDVMEEDKQQYAGKWLDDNLIPPCLKPKDQVKHILDIGCGTGRASINLANHFPNANVIGIDINEYAIEKADMTKNNEKIKNVEFIKVGVEEMSTDWNNKFDWIVAIEVLHDLPDPEPSIECIKRALKDDGVMTALEPVAHSDHKDNRGAESTAAMYSISCFICLPSSLSTEPAAGNGVGWGLENRAKFLKSHGFKIIGEEITGIIHCMKA